MRKTYSLVFVSRIFLVVMFWLFGKLAIAIPVKAWESDFKGNLEKVGQEALLNKGKVKLETWNTFIRNVNMHDTIHQLGLTVPLENRGIELDIQGMQKLENLVEYVSNLTDQLKENKIVRKSEEHYNVPDEQWKKIIDLIKGLRKHFLNDGGGSGNKQLLSSYEKILTERGIKFKAASEGPPKLTQYIEEKEKILKGQRMYIGMALALIVLLTAILIFQARRLLKTVLISQVSKFYKKFRRKEEEEKAEAGEPVTIETLNNSKKDHDEPVKTEVNQEEPAWQGRQYHAEESDKIQQYESQWHHETELRLIGELLKDHKDLYGRVIEYTTNLTQSEKKVIAQTTTAVGYEINSDEARTRFIYFKEPNAEGYFLHSKRLSEPSLTLYSLATNPAGDEASFRFDAAEPQTISQALSYVKYKIEPVCDMEGIHSERATMVTAVEDGQVKLNSSGEWIVTKKAKVRLS